MNIVFATRNPHKLQEVQSMMPSHIKLINLNDIDCTEEIPETSGSIEGNAIQKATYVAERYNLPCFADDSGLEISALNGRPGVDTAHYAGAQRSHDDNMSLVLNQLNGIYNRDAQFVSVIALVMNGETHTFKGVVKGVIAPKRQNGKYGFGYDPIFIPDALAEGQNVKKNSYAQIPSEIKNKSSHRAQSIHKLNDHLSKDNA